MARICSNAKIICFLNDGPGYFRGLLLFALGEAQDALLAVSAAYCTFRIQRVRPGGCHPLYRADLMRRAACERHNKCDNSSRRDLPNLYPKFAFVHIYLLLKILNRLMKRLRVCHP